MKKIFILSVLILGLSACATRTIRQSNVDDAGSRQGKATASSRKAEKPAKVQGDDGAGVESVRNAGIVVDPQELVLLERMQKAVEVYVHRGEKKEFSTLCKDKRFDCFLNEKPLPAKKKKVVRSVPPYASGSKMGLQGEERIHLRYDFFP